MIKMNKLTKTLERLNNTYKLCELFLKQFNKKYPEKIYYIALLRDFCYNKGNKLYTKTNYYKFINLYLSYKINYQPKSKELDVYLTFQDFSSIDKKLKTKYT